MALYEVTVTGTVAGQQAIWRSNWQSIDPDPLGNLFAYRLLQAMGWDETDPGTPLADTVFEYFQNCNTGNSVITSLFARNIYSDTDFYEVPLGAGWVGGQSGGLYMPPFVCAQWQSNRTNLAVRRGHISTWGIQEANVDDSSQVVGSDLTNPMDDFAAEMSSTIQWLIGLQQYDYRSCILSKERYEIAGTGTDPTTNPTRWAYRYYETEAEQLDHAALGVDWTRMLPVSSRISRKVGRGR